jgi:ketosteroid isomerase-like protein
VQSADGNIALTQAKWSVTGTDHDGKPVTMSGRSAEVARRQADGTRKFVIDQPPRTGYLTAVPEMFGLSPIRLTSRRA